MYSAFDHWAYWSHMLTVISMFSPCTQWVFGPLSPVWAAQSWWAHYSLLHHHSLTPNRPSSPSSCCTTNGSSKSSSTLKLHLPIPCVSSVRNMQHIIVWTVLEVQCVKNALSHPTPRSLFTPSRFMNPYILCVSITEYLLAMEWQVFWTNYPHCAWPRPPTWSLCQQHMFPPVMPL